MTCTVFTIRGSNYRVVDHSIWSSCYTRFVQPFGSGLWLMLCGIIPVIAPHPYDLHNSVVSRSQLSPVAGDANELLSVLKAA